MVQCFSFFGRIVSVYLSLCAIAISCAIDIGWRGIVWMRMAGGMAGAHCVKCSGPFGINVTLIPERQFSGHLGIVRGSNWKGVSFLLFYSRALLFLALASREGRSGDFSTTD